MRSNYSYAMVQTKEGHEMTLILRLLLLICAVFFLLYVANKLHRSSIKITDMIFWVVLSILFIIMGTVPTWFITLSGFFGFESPVNFIFLVVIFLLLWKMFILSIQLSRTSEMLKDEIESAAIRERMFSEEQERDHIKKETTYRNGNN